MVLKYLEVFEIIVILIRMSGKNIISVFEINRDFKKKFHTDIPYKKFHFETLKDFLQSFRRVRFIGHSNGEYFTILEESNSISAEIKAIFMKLNDKLDKETTVTALMDKFKKYHPEKYNSKDLNRSEIKNFLLVTYKNVRDVETIKSEKIEVERVKKYNKIYQNKPASKEAIEELNNAAKLFGNCDFAPKKFAKETIESGYVQYGVKLRRQTVADVPIGTTVPIIVYELYDLSKFWIQLANKEIYDKFTTLLVEMKQYYDDSRRYENLKVKDEHLLPNYLCVVNFENWSDSEKMRTKQKLNKLRKTCKKESEFSSIANNCTTQYHRAEILRKLDSDNYHCYFVDYGTHRVISKSQILYMMKEFSELPGQAIRARLTNIRPVDRDVMWSYDSILCFKSWVHEKHQICAKLIEVSKSKKSEEIIMIELMKKTASSAEESLNRHLIDCQLAVPEHVPRQLSHSFTLAVPNAYLYPTFDEIESNFYPSSNFYHYLLSNGISLNFIFYFYLNAVTIENYLELIEEARQFLTSMD